MLHDISINNDDPQEKIRKLNFKIKCFYILRGTLNELKIQFRLGKLYI